MDWMGIANSDSIRLVWNSMMANDENRMRSYELICNELELSTGGGESGEMWKVVRVCCCVYGMVGLAFGGVLMLLLGRGVLSCSH